MGDVSSKDPDDIPRQREWNQAAGWVSAGRWLEADATTQRCRHATRPRGVGPERNLNDSGRYGDRTASAATACDFDRIIGILYAPKSRIVGCDSSRQFVEICLSQDNRTCRLKPSYSPRIRQWLPVTESRRASRASKPDGIK